MKRLAGFILLGIAAVLCASCASTQQIDPEVVHVTMKNGMHVSGTLVMVRDSGFVLDLLCQSWKTHTDNESAALHWIPSQSVCRVHAPEIPYSGASAGNGFLIGAGAGALLPVATGEPVYALVYPLLFAPIGMIIGVVAEALSTKSELDIDPSTPDAVLELISRAPMIEPPAEAWMFAFDRSANTFTGRLYRKNEPSPEKHQR